MIEKNINDTILSLNENDLLHAAYVRKQESCQNTLK